MKKTRTLSTKLLAIILSLAIAVVSLPMSAFAIDSEADQETKQSLTVSNEPVELIDERTADTKRFRMEDGSFVVAQYDTAVHYLDENGHWQDIDNRLTADGSEISTSNAKIKFAKKTTGNGNLFALHDGNRKITLSLDGANKKVEGQITNFETDFGEDTTKLEKMTTLDRVSASVKYENILENTDLEYVVHGLNIKENIIVKAKGDSYVYSFTMALNQLSAQKTSKGEIEILDSATNEVVYLIPAPIMWDADGISSCAAEYTLSDLGNGKYTLTVSADSSWMNAVDRAYPVTIDPPIYSSGSKAASDFTYNVNTQTYDTNSGELWVGANYISYWRLDTLPVLPTSAYVASAEFSMNGYDNNTGGHVGIYDVVTEYDAYSNWDFTDPLDYHLYYAADFTDFDTVNSDGLVMDSVQSFRWDITPLVKKWYGSEHFGLIIAPVNSSDFPGYVRFFSEEYAQTSMRPVLSITYYDMKGIESYWGFTSQSVGFAGSGAVNHALGQLTFTIPTLTTTDALMPYTPTLVYNSSMSGYATPHAANGFKWNFQESLRSVDLPSLSGYETFLVYSDSDGTEHYFYHEIDNLYRDEDGLQLTLEYNAESNEYTMTDSSKTKRLFKCYGADSGWYLASISDFHGNQVLFDFDAAYRVTGINLLPNGYSEANKICQMKIEYFDSGAPYVVWNPNSKEAVIFRYSATPTGSIAIDASQYLRQVVRVRSGASGSPDWEDFYETNANSGFGTYVVDAVAEYAYDNGGDLCRVTNNLAKIYVRYDLDLQKRVNTVMEYADTVAGSDSGDVMGQSLQFIYGVGNTQIRSSGTDDVLGNSDDLLTVYTYDAHGRTVGSYTTNLSKTIIYSASHGAYIDSGSGDPVNNRLSSSVQTAQHSSNYLLNGGFEDSSIDNYWNSSGAVWFSGEDTYQGAGAVKLETSAAASQAWVAQDVALDAGEYSISLMYKSADMRNVRMYIKAESSNAAHSVVKEIPVNADASETYSYAGLRFTAAPGTAGGKETFTITVMISGLPLLELEPTVYVDNIMLSRTTGAAEHDMVKMGHFESTHLFDEASDFWSYEYTGAPAVTVVDSGVEAFGDVLKMEAPIGDARGFVTQTVPLNFSESQSKVYTLSAWAKGTAQSSSGDFSVGIRVNYVEANGTSRHTFESFDFCKTITDWQFISGCFETDPTKGTPVSIDIILYYYSNPGVGYFDSISLVESSSNATVYGYDPNGNLASTANGLSSANFEYGDPEHPHRLTREVHSNGIVTDYRYETNAQMQEKIDKVFSYKHNGTVPFNPAAYLTLNSNSLLSNENLTCILATETVSNRFGLQTSSTVYDASNANIKSTTTATYNVGAGYEHIFGTLATETNARGELTRYAYNMNTGWLRVIIYPDSTGIIYSYDGMGNLIEVQPCDATGTPTAADDNEVKYTYDSATKRLSKITTDSTTYTLGYDNFGNSKYVQAGNYALAGYTYNPNNGKLSILTYGNGLKVKYLYDSLDRISEICYNVSGSSYQTAYTYTYNSLGNLFSVEDHESGEVTVFEYDMTGRMVGSQVYETQTYKTQYGSHVEYDEDSRVRKISYQAQYKYGTLDTPAWAQQFYTFGYSEETGYLQTLTFADNAGLSGTVSLSYNAFGLTTQKAWSFAQSGTAVHYGSQSYSYYQANGNQTALVSQLTVQSGKNASNATSSTYCYTYDANGNITKINTSQGSVLYRYTYDALGQLIQEDNVPLNRRYVWTYDNAGNILSKKTYNIIADTDSGVLISTKNYTYGNSTWGDLLTKVGSDSIEYDKIGNPTIWGQKNEDGIWFNGALLEWQGRQLQKYQPFNEYDDGSGDMYYPVYFKYNDEGIRTYKEQDGVDHEYILDGSRIIGEWIYNRTILILYIYDDTGSPVGMKMRTASQAEGVFDEYFFEKNLQGDIVAVYNSEGEKIGTYTYDAWGNFTVTLTTGNTTAENNIVNTYNPFRYRGYYYDVETGLYYLQSRYYNPAWGRFINADGYVSTGQGLLGTNMFAYCGNNPVNRADDTGEFWITALLIAAVVAVGVTLSGCSSTDKDKIVDPGKFDTAEDAVIDFGEKYLFESIKKDKEFLTVIYEMEENGKVYYTYDRVIIGDRHSVPVMIDESRKYVAIVHTHGNYSDGHKEHQFSPNDKAIGKKRGVPMYLFTAAKYLLKYDPSDDSVTSLNDWNMR